MKKYLHILITVAALSINGCATRRTGPARPDETAAIMPAAGEKEIAALFDRWNESLQTGSPRNVVAHYAEQSILLPTVSNKPRLTAEEKADYFAHFLENQPVGEINMRQIQTGSDMAVDSGIYTFTFAKTGAQVRARFSFTYRRYGQEWLIISHHSSAMPEAGE